MTHSLPEVAETVGISPKAFAAAVAPIVVGIVLSAGFALLDYVMGHPELIATLPPVVQVAVTASLASLAAAVAAYRAKPGVVVGGNAQSGTQG